MDIALGNPVCLTVAGEKRICRIVRKEFIDSNRRELTSYYNFDAVGVEACGALKNIVANVKGVTDCLDLGDSIPGTLFSRSGVEVRSLSRLLGGSFQAFQSQAGVGDMYVTLSSDASKNHRYGRFFYELFTGNSVETHLKVLQRIDGKPEGPNTILNVHKFLEKRNMYSPIFHCAYKIFNEDAEPGGDPGADSPGDAVRPPDEGVHRSRIAAPLPPLPEPLVPAAPRSPRQSRK